MYVPERHQEAMSDLWDAGLHIPTLSGLVGAQIEIEINKDADINKRYKGAKLLTSIESVWTASSLGLMLFLRPILIPGLGKVLYLAHDHAWYMAVEGPNFSNTFKNDNFYVLVRNLHN